MKFRFALALMLSALAMGFAAPNTAQASTIFACVLKTTGTIRLVSPSTTCSRFESPLNWDSAGAAGPPGAQGPAGVTAGVNAAVWGQLRITKTSDAPFTETCEIPFQRGGTMTGEWTGNNEECFIHVTPDDHLSWGTAYICYTSIGSGNGTPASTVAQFSQDMDTANNNYPKVIVDARADPYVWLPVGSIIDVGFLCIR